MKFESIICIDETRYYGHYGGWVMMMTTTTASDARVTISSPRDYVHHVVRIGSPEQGIQLHGCYSLTSYRKNNILALLIITTNSTILYYYIHQLCSILFFSVTVSHSFTFKYTLYKSHYSVFLLGIKHCFNEVMFSPAE